MEDAFPFSCCLVGGTFDHLHAGHRHLLYAASNSAHRIEVHITSDEMAADKSDFIQSFEHRREAILNWAQKYAPNRVTVHELMDEYGPASEHVVADCIVSTVETKPRCEMINEERQKQGLPPLSILVVEHYQDTEDIVLSSTRIRLGEIDQEGHPWIPLPARQWTYKMAPALDAELKQPMGDLYEGPEHHPEVAMSNAIEELPHVHGPLIAVGDVSVQTLLMLDIVPDVALVDGYTQREALDEALLVSHDSFDFVFHADNPAGQLTPSLFESIQHAIQSEGSSLIQVNGEEDLAPIVLHLLLPLESVVIYGQPKRGVVVQIVTTQTKERCRFLLSQFEVMHRG